MHRARANTTLHSDNTQFGVVVMVKSRQSPCALAPLTLVLNVDRAALLQGRRHPLVLTNRSNSNPKRDFESPDLNS